MKIKKVIHVVSISGGKDSTVTMSIAINRVGKENCRFIYCDTGNEHPLVYLYIDYLEIRFGVKIDRLKNDFTARINAKRLFVSKDQRRGRDKKGRKMRWSNKHKRAAIVALKPTGIPFLDLCLWKGRFPSRKAQFCTEQLKTILAVAYQSALIDQGYNVISWQGVRRDESDNRKNAKKAERISLNLFAFRPLVSWSAADVFEYHATNGIEPNPLYKLGMSRVGCMPCINVNKQELREISSRFPEVIDRIAEWELLVGQASKRGYSTFKADKSDLQNRKEIFEKLCIRERVRWSKTSHGGRRYTLLSAMPSPECSSSYGLCE